MEDLRKKLKEAFQTLYFNIDTPPGMILEHVEDVITKEDGVTIRIPIGFPDPNGCNFLKNITDFMRYFDMVGKESWVVARLSHDNGVCQKNKQCFYNIRVMLAEPPTP